MKEQMSNLDILQQYLQKQKVGYHKHDAWLEHPVAVKDHAEHFKVALEHLKGATLPLLSFLTTKNLIESVDFDWGMKKLDAIKTLREYSIGKKKAFEVANQFSTWNVPIDIVSHLLTSVDVWKEKQKKIRPQEIAKKPIFAPQTEEEALKFFEDLPIGATFAYNNGEVKVRKEFSNVFIVNIKQQHFATTHGAKWFAVYFWAQPEEINESLKIPGDVENGMENLVDYLIPSFSPESKKHSVDAIKDFENGKITFEKLQDILQSEIGWTKNEWNSLVIEMKGGKIGFHEHEAWPIHPVAVKDHAEYFIGKPPDKEKTVTQIGEDYAQGILTLDEAKKELKEKDYTEQQAKDFLSNAAAKIPEEEKNWDDVLEDIGPQLGSTEGGAYQDKNTGQHFYIKFPGEERAEIENLASRLYALAGVPVAQTEVIDFKGKRAIKSTWIAGHPMELEDMHHSSAVVKNFAIDAWLGNWDVVGLDSDNIISYGGSGFRIDTGGALTYRAMGEKKKFGPVVKELKTFLDPAINPQAAKVFGNVPNEVLAVGVNTLSQITNEQIENVVRHTNLDSNLKIELYDTLIARRDYIVKEFAKAKISKPAKPGFHKHDNLKEHPIMQRHRGAPKILDIDKLLSTHKNPKVREVYQKTIKFFRDNMSDVMWASPKNVRDAITALNIPGNQEIFYVLEGWQTGSSSMSRGQIAIRAAINELKGIADKEYAAENAFWTFEKSMKPSDFSLYYSQGRQNALALIPHILASREVLAGEFSNGVIPIIYRGITGANGKKLREIVLKMRKEDKIAMPHDSISGYTLKRNIASSNASNGVIFSKKNILIKNVWGYFNAWSHGFREEEELFVDSDTVTLFSKDEIETP